MPQLEKTKGKGKGGWFGDSERHRQAALTGHAGGIYASDRRMRTKEERLKDLELKEQAMYLPKKHMPEDFYDPPYSRHQINRYLLREIGDPKLRESYRRYLRDPTKKRYNEFEREIGYAFTRRERRKAIKKQFGTRKQYLEALVPYRSKMGETRFILFLRDYLGYTKEEAIALNRSVIKVS